jgi:23S rRNA pseudouridine1911/1915/1917 synthase
MNQGWCYQERVTSAVAGLTVLAYYTQRYCHSSPAEWQTRIEAGQVLLDGLPVTMQTPLKAGQQLTYHRLPWDEPDVPLTVEVLYEDADVWVVVKPSGLPVLPGGGFLEHTLLRQLQQRYPQATPIPIHRLGRGTSGLMLLARSPLVRAHLSRQLRDHHIQKRYRALVGAGPMPNEFTITQPIGKIPHSELGYVYGAASAGKFAQSDCRVLKRTADTTLLDVKILTGRPHQIRIHLAAAGYPLLGDPFYAIGGIPRSQPVHEAQKQPVPGDCGYWLHAYALSFLHPQTEQPIHLTCPAPAALCE